MTIHARSALEIGIPCVVTLLPRGGESSLGESDFSNPFVVRKLETWTGAYNAHHISASLTVTAENLSPGSADIDGFPVVDRAASYPADGTTVRIRLSNGRTRKTLSLNLATSGSPVGGWKGYSIVPDTQYTAALDLLTPLIETDGKDVQVYRDKSTLIPKDIIHGSSRNNIERNPNWWGDSDWDISGIPIWNSSSNSPSNGMALVTPNHLFAAHHYKPSVGTTVEFLGNNGVVYTRTIIGQCSYVPATDQALLADSFMFTLDPAPPGFAANVIPVELIGPWLVEEGVDGTYSVMAGMFLNQNRRGYFMIGLGLGASGVVDPYYRVLEGTYNGVAIDLPVSGLPALGLLELDGEPYLDNQYRGEPISGDSGGPYFHITPTGLKLAGLFDTPGGPYPDGTLLNAMIGSSDADAISRGNLASPTGSTVTVATDPML